MTYSQYLQKGDKVVEQPQPVTSDDPIEQLVLDAMFNDNKDALQQIQQIVQAAEQGDPEAQQIAQQIQAVMQKIQQENVGEPNSLKCGGKVRAKVKKACGGRKMETGDKIPEAKCGKKMKKAETGLPIKKVSKGGCPCQLKKVGGKLVEVDCNNQIVKALEGTKLYNIDPIPMMDIRDIDPMIAHRKDYMAWKQQNQQQAAQAERTQRNQQAVRDLENSTRAGGINYGLVLPSTDNPYTNVFNKIVSSVKTTSQSKPQSTVENQPSVNTYKGLFADTNLSDKSFAGRKAWLNDAANADYLAQANLGFDASNYTGTAEQNKALLNAINGKADWDEMQASKAANANLTALQPSNNYIKSVNPNGIGSVAAYNNIPVATIHAKTPSGNKTFAFEAKPSVSKPAGQINTNLLSQAAFNAIGGNRTLTPSYQKYL